jgi:hypothetical protein
MSSRERRPTVAVVAAVAAVAAVGWVAVSHLVGDGSSAAQRTSVAVPVVTSVPSSSPRGATEQVTAGPDGDSSGVPTGYVDTAAGARAAAVGWVSSLGTLVRLGPIATADALRAVTSARVAEATIDRFRTERDQFTNQFHADPSRAIWIESPLTVTVTDWSPAVATVRVWSQLVVGVGSESTVQVMWRTHTVRLVWEHGDWKVDDVTQTEGPTPQTMPENLPSSGAEFEAMSQWNPAVLAGSSVEG